MATREEKQQSAKAALDELDKLPIALQFEVAIDCLKRATLGEISGDAVSALVNPIFDRVREHLKSAGGSSAVKEEPGGAR